MPRVLMTVWLAISGRALVTIHLSFDRCTAIFALIWEQFSLWVEVFIFHTYTSTAIGISLSYHTPTVTLISIKKLPGPRSHTYKGFLMPLGYRGFLSTRLRNKFLLKLCFQFRGPRYRTTSFLYHTQSMMGILLLPYYNTRDTLL